jgi:NAD(P)H-hydrate epimerase
MTGQIHKIEALPRLPPRAPDAHKGSFGHVLIVGGCRRMSGAVALAVNAALRGGAGLVEFAAPAGAHPIIAGLCPCAVSMPLACDEAGELSPAAGPQVRRRMDDASVLAVGPGFDVGLVQQNIVRAALEQDRPTVIDADGLNNLVKIDNWPALRRCPLIITPHPGEFSRLTGKTIREIQANREAIAVETVREWLRVSTAANNAAVAPAVAPGVSPGVAPGGQLPGDDPPLVLVLKGAGTVVTDGRRVFVNSTGNPGLATGGTGDVLTGLTAALLAQHLGPFEAACLAVRCHGRAGDLAAADLGQVSLIASDLIDYLPQAMKEAT